MSDKAQAVRCMLLPLAALNVLIPNSAVAEIIGYSSPLKLNATSDWFAGVVLWRGVYVPVVALEEMCAIGSAMVGPRTRIAIIYNPEKDPELPYLGLHIQDIPRAYLAEPDTVHTATDDGLSPYLLSRIGEDELLRVIPNLDRVIETVKSEFSQEKIAQLGR